MRRHQHKYHFCFLVQEITNNYELMALGIKCTSNYISIFLVINILPLNTSIRAARKAHKGIHQTQLLLSLIQTKF